MFLIRKLFTSINFVILQILFIRAAAAARLHGAIAVDASSPSPYDFIRSLKFNNSTVPTVITTSTTTATVINNDLLCNNDSEFVCICQHNTGNLLRQYILCNQLIEMDELPVIEMNIRRVNLSARLHTNETYESYFKRRVAAVVSNYCEQQVDECMATTLRLKKENVVLLNVKQDEPQTTTVGFVVTKSQRRSMLGAGTILDSTKVKYILSAQLAALSRVLGGVRIERVETATLRRYGENGDGAATQRDNTRLLIILSIVATFLIVTYTIAAVRVCRDCTAKKRAKKSATKLNKITETPNYGTCQPSKQSDITTGQEAQNAVIKAKTSRQNAQVPFETRNLTAEEVPVMDAYRMRRMFQCDPSQLPAEEALMLSQSSDDLTTMHGSTSLRGAAETALYKSRSQDMIPKTVVTEDASPVKKDGETPQESEIFVEIPQKYAKPSIEPQQNAEESESKQNTTTYSSEHERSEEQTAEPVASVWKEPTTEESFNAAWDQPEIAAKPTYSTWSETTTTEPLHKTSIQQTTVVESPLEPTWNQPRTTDETARLVKELSAESPYNQTNSYSESSLEPAEQYDEEMITLELHPTSQETESEITPGTVYLKRVSLTDQPNYLKHPQNSNFSGKDVDIEQIIPKSRTAHQFEHWSSESDDGASDAYHKLSEAEDDSEAGVRPEIVASTTEKMANFVNSTEIPQTEDNDSEMNMDLHSGPFTVDSDEPCYERLQESPVTPNSFSLSPTSDVLTPQQLVNSTSTDDLK